MAEIPAKKLTQEDLIEVTSPQTKATMRFKTIISAIAWGDPEARDEDYVKSAIVCGGEQENGVINLFRSYSGHVFEIIPKAIEWKDLFLTRYVSAPESPAGFFYQLTDEDGLSRYKIKGYDARNQPIYRKKSTAWKHYRGWDTTAIIMPQSEELELDFPGSAEQVQSLIRSKEVVVVWPFFPRVRKTETKLPVKQVASADYRAFISCAWELWNRKPKTGAGTREEKKGMSTWGDFYR